MNAMPKADQAVQIAAKRRVNAHLHAEVFHHRHAFRAGDAAGGFAQQGLIDFADLGELRDGNAGENIDDRFAAVGVSRQPVACDQVFLH